MKLNLNPTILFSLIFLLMPVAIWPAKLSAQNTPSPSPTLAPVVNPIPLQTNQPLSVTVSPPVSYMSVKPGEELKHTVEVRNTGNQLIQVSANITDFQPDGKTGRPIISSGNSFDKFINPNLNFGQKFTLQPGENKSITLGLKISTNAPQKEYPLTILFSASPLTALPGQTQVSSIVGSNLILLISDSNRSLGRLELEKLKIPKVIDSLQPVEFSILLKNEGQSATPIRGRIRLKNFLDQTISEYIFYPDYILADSTRLVRAAKVRPELLDSQGKIKPETVNKFSTQMQHNSLFLLGPYQLELTIADQTTTHQVVALPLSALATIIIGGLIFAGFLQLKKRWR